MSRALVYGNGKSRLKWDLNQELQDNITTWGCNRIYNDVKVDNLVALDYWVQHAIYTSGYAKDNKCWFSNFDRLSSYLHDTIKSQYGHMTIVENDRGNREYCSISGSHDDPNFKGLYITWLDKDDMVVDIDFPKQWSSGTTAIHLACQKGATEIYLMGFDLSENPLNNVYEEIQKQQKMTSIDQLVKIDPHRFWHRSDWANEMKTVIQEFPNTKFIWIEPHEKSMKFDMNNLTYDTYENIRRNICR